MKKKIKVEVDWIDNFDCWKWFYLLEIKEGMIYLKGRDSPEGHKHDGDRFWVPTSAIYCMAEVK